MEYKLFSDDMIEGMLDLYAPYIVNTPVTFEVEVPSLPMFKARIEAISRMYPVIVCLERGKVAGYGYAHPQHERAAYQWNAELSVYVAEEQHHKGIGKGLYSRLLALLRLQNIVRVYSLITVPNEASMGLHRVFGFSQCGLLAHTGYKFGCWYDVAWLEKVIHETEVPLPLLSIHQVDHEKVEQVLRGDPNSISAAQEVCR